MSYVPQVDSQLMMLGVVDSGSPNFERVVIRVTGPMSLNGFGVALGVSDKGRIHPIYDNCFWFPEIHMPSPGWVNIYTRRGQLEWTSYEGEPVLNLFWLRDRTIFSPSAPAVVPMLFRAEGANWSPRG